MARTLRWEDLSVDQQADVDSQMADIGRALPDRLQSAQAANTAAMERTSNPHRQRKLRNDNDVIDAVGGQIESRPITREQGQATRVDLVRGAADRARAAGETVPRGTGWYFDHGRKILAERDSVAPGVSDEAAVTATTILSPQTGPAMERSAGAGAMALASNPSMQVSRSEAKQVNARLARDTKLETGRVPSGAQTASQRSSSELAAMTTVAGVSPETDALRSTMAGTGAKRKAVDVARGDVEPDDVRDPVRSPKVFNYTENTLEAGRSSAQVEDEYVARGQMLVSGEQQFDFHGLRQSEEGILSPDRETVEDTWQQAFNTGQPLDRGSGRASPAKFVTSAKGVAESSGAIRKPKGSPLRGDADLTSANLVHAFSAASTRGAARQLSDEVGFPVPSVMVQEVGWTEGRIQARKDPEYAAEQRDAVAARRPPANTQTRGQRRLF